MKSSKQHQARVTEIATAFHGGSLNGRSFIRELFEIMAEDSALRGVAFDPRLAANAVRPRYQEAASELALIGGAPRASKIEGPDEGSCDCGWPLPRGTLPVMAQGGAVAFTDLLDDGTELVVRETSQAIPGACVTLRCPGCDIGHAFYLEPEQLPHAGNA